MKPIGTLESIWRYPVKSMRGEQVEDVFVAYTGVMGDRLYAISSSAAPPEFPWHTNREQEEFILYGARYRHREKTLRPAAMEAAFKEAGLSKDSSEDELLDAMAASPILMERPIVVAGKKAVVGRPPEDVEQLL